MNKSQTLSLLSLSLLGSVLAAQEPPARNPDPKSPPPAATPSNRASNQVGDAILITTLLVENENEIAISRLALQHAASADVKQFAQQMIDDHEKIVQKLQQAGGKEKQGVGARTTPAERGSEKSAETRPADASGIRAAGAFDHESLIRDLGKQCLDSATKMLQEKQGAEFDRCFMGMQLGAHIHAVDTLTVYQNYASESLRPTLAEGLKTVQMHLQHAKDLAKRTELASADSRR